MKMGRVGKQAAAKKPRAPKTAAHQLAESVPEGTVFTDLVKKQWCSGKPIGSGGFGLIYLAGPNDGTPVTDDALYVLKVEPHSNGPLFCELSFYTRIAKPEMIQAWKSKNKITDLGMPNYVASGSYEQNGNKYRFMIMERFSTDLQKLFEQNKKSFPTHTVFSMGMKLLDVLQYIHEHEYVHGDIKASNILQGYKRGTTDQIYLVDFGLAYRYTSGGKHKEYKEDPRKKHDGTIEFTSRDAHKGVTNSRRGDLEILGYCMVQWLCGVLPWEDKLSNKDYVAAQKEKHMSDISGFMRTCFSENQPEIEQYLQIVADMDYEEEPDYRACKKCFKDALKRLGFKENVKLEFGKTTATRTPRKRESDRFGSPKRASKRSAVKSPAVKSPAVKSPAAGRLKLSVKSPAVKSPAAGRLKLSVKSPAVQSPAVKSPAAGRLKLSASKVRKQRGRQSTESTSPVSIAKTLNIPEGAMNGTALKRKSPAAKSPSLGDSKKIYKIKRPKGVREVLTVATQTSPGLKGLKRSRKS